MESKRIKLKERIEVKTLKLGGDGRNDSVGHSAKYGSYTLMDLEGNKIMRCLLCVFL